MLITQHIEPWHWAWGGAVIALVTVALQYLSNRSLGISGGLENICALAIRNRYFSRPALADAARWRLPFLAGLVLGGAASALLAGGWTATWELGMFDTYIGWGARGKVLWMFTGGLFIGFGTRLAGGCTSGHGIFGNATFQPASFIATVSFMAAGAVTTNLVYRFLYAG